MSAILQDLRYALRVFGKNPGFTAVVILTLALGIGVNTAVFSVVNGVLLHPLPYPNADDLVVLWSRIPGRNVSEETLSPAMCFEIKDQTQVFSQVATIRTHSFTLTGFGPPERVRGVRATAGCLSILGAKPALGRIFNSDDTESKEAQGIVLSHALWVRRFGSDPAILGRIIRFDEQDYTVIGVLEDDFPATRMYLPMLHDHHARIDYWIPLAFDDVDKSQHGRQNYNVLARLAHGIGIADAQAEMNLLAGRMSQAFPQFYPPGDGFALEVVPLIEPMVREIRPALRLLTGAAALVLLIACANVANLLLARATSRRREIATRMALGAGHARITLQLLTESVLLSLSGGAAGLLVAWWGTSMLLSVGRQSIPRIGEVAIDSSAVAFTAGISLLTGIVFGLAPTWSAVYTSLHQAIRDGGFGLMGSDSPGRQRYSTRNLLIVTEVSLSVVLLIGAGLLIHSFYRLQNVDPGFAPKNVLSFQLPRNPDFQANLAAYQTFYADLREQLVGMPGVESVGGMSVLPLTPGESFAPVEVEGYTPARDEQELQANSCCVLWDCFETLVIPLLAGRYFDERDTPDGTPVAIIDETFAQRFWPNENPLGKRIRDAGLGQAVPWLTVVGVVGSVRRSDLESDSAISYYQPYSQWMSQSMYIVVRTSSDPEELAGAITRKIWSLNENWPVLEMATMEERVSAVFARRRFSLFVLGTFAFSALILAAVGIYAVLAQRVNQGTHDIGIRMALGARQSHVLCEVLRRGLMLTGIGLGVGLLLSLAATRFMTSLLYEVETVDPVTFLGVPAVLGVVALLACYLPARRAAQVDPMAALRCE